MDENMEETFTTEEESASETKRKRIRRNPQQLAESIEVQIEELEATIEKVELKKQDMIEKYDNKINDIHVRIEELRQKKQSLLNPKPRKRRKTKKEKFEELLKKAMKSGLSFDDINHMLDQSDHQNESEANEDEEESEYENDNEGNFNEG